MSNHANNSECHKTAVKVKKERHKADQIAYEEAQMLNQKTTIAHHFPSLDNPLDVYNLKEKQGINSYFSKLILIT